MPHHIALYLCGDTDAWCTSNADWSTERGCAHQVGTYFRRFFYSIDVNFP